jgi:hypothetical protein
MDLCHNLIDVIDLYIITTIQQSDKLQVILNVNWVKIINLII